VQIHIYLKSITGSTPFRGGHREKDFGRLARTTGEVDLILGQVPAYLIIGNGRVARHTACYFDFLGISYTQWHRGMTEEDLRAKAAAASHILVLIRDDAIADFALFHLSGFSAVKIHFSGALVAAGIYGAHPLMTFGPELYTRDKYQSIPFIIEDDAPDFAALLPGLPNTHARIKKSDKAKYHALCAMAGNFSCLLWQKLMDSFAQDFGLPPEAAQAYLRQQTDNLISDYTSALTGPLVRGDGATVQKHLAALKGDPFHDVYQSFIAAYGASKEKRT